MAETFNAICKVCQKPYHKCKACDNKKGGIHYKLVADSVNCFQIYATLVSHMTDAEKRAALLACDLSQKDTFKDSIRESIDKLLAVQATSVVEPVVEEATAKVETEDVIQEEKKNYNKKKDKSFRYNKSVHTEE